MRERIAHCTVCEQRVLTEWSGGEWRYVQHCLQVPTGLAVRGDSVVGVAVKNSECLASGRKLPPGVFAISVPFDPEYDDPMGAGWIISDEYWG